jgi:[acyl-carrier-protein] S-malonyltransferase
MAVGVALVFPGQGSQFVGMADPWLEHEAGRAVLTQASEALGRDVVTGCHDETELASTDFVQPALLACDVAAFRILEAEGASVMGVAGHSLGEFAALVASGVIELDTALDLVVVRGRAMQEAGRERPGTMTALLGVDAERAGELCDAARGDEVLIVANENSPQQTVISGSVGAVERAERMAADQRIRAVRLKVAGAFHSPLMEPAVTPLSEAIDRSSFQAPRFPVAANVSGELTWDPEELRELLRRHVVSPVRWEGCARSLAAGGADTFVEAGPGDVLTKLAKRVVPDARAVSVGNPAEVAAFVASLSSG